MNRAEAFFLAAVRRLDTASHHGASRPRRPRRISVHAEASLRTGCTVSGPGFHVWDEDATYARDWAAELRASLASAAGRALRE